MNTTTILITSEHGGNQIPEEYKYLFKNQMEILNTHRGYDIGIWFLAEKLSEKIKARLFKTNISRLLVDVNRSLWRRTLFSEISKALTKEEKQTILNKYYYAHRNKISAYIKKEIEHGQKVLHIATHSFTPVLKGNERNAEIGFLYNPERSNEKLICKKWKKYLNESAPQLRVRFNYPYRGKPDGLTAHFRKIYPNNSYMGIELEVNQKFVTENGNFADELATQIISSFIKTLQTYSWL